MDDIKLDLRESLKLVGMALGIPVAVVVILAVVLMLFGGAVVLP